MERMLVTKILLNRAGNVELYARGHRFRDTLLFDPSDLLEVGIDPNDLPTGQEVAVRFWALYEPSDRLNQNGNPYKDIVALEPADKPAASTSVDESAVLEELRAIRALLERLVGDSTSTQEPQEEGSADSPAQTAPDRPQDDPHPALDDGQARREFYRLAGPAVRDGKITPNEVNELAGAGMAKGWPIALCQLHTSLQGRAA